MGIINIDVPLPGQVGIYPRTVKLVTTDNLATITTAGYLNNFNLQGSALTPADVIECLYSFNINTNVGTYEVFTTSFSNGVITLVQWSNPGNVLLPVVSGDVAIFNGTTGQIKDSGVAFSNGTDTVASLFHGTATVGDFVTVNNANKTIQDSGAAPSAASQPFVVMSPGSLTSGNIPFLNDANGTLNTGRAPSAATAGYKVVMSPGSVTSGNLPVFNDVNGTIGDSGIVAANLQTLTTTVTLNQAAIQAAYATPFQLIAAPGAGKAIMVLNAVIYTNFQTSAFTAGGVAIVQYAATVHGAGTNALSATIPAAEITAASSQIYSLNQATATLLTGITNAGIFFSNQTQAFTGGSASSTVVITLSYSVITATV